jgi:hypothetical protein
MRDRLRYQPQPDGYGYSRTPVTLDEVIALLKTFPLTQNSVRPQKLGNYPILAEIVYAHDSDGEIAITSIKRF